MSVIESARQIVESHQYDDEVVRLARFVLSLSERLIPDVLEAAERLDRYAKGENARVIWGFDGEEMDAFMYRTLEHAYSRDRILLVKSVALPIIAQLREGT